jgi:hypothetical protein
MADGLGDIFVGLDDFRKFSADSFLQNANRLIGDVWTQHTIDNIPQMAGDIWTQHVTNQLPNLTSMFNPPAPPQSPVAAPSDPFAPITSPSTTPTIPTAPAPSAGADSGTLPPAPPPAPAAGVPDQQQGGGGSIADLIRQAAIRHGIDPDVAVRVAQSEGGLSNPANPGDSGSSFGPFQLHYGNVAAGGNAVAGMGDDFTQQTGLDARDPANVAQAIDFALAHAARAGWGAFHGAARVGIGAMEGIGQAAGQAAQQAASGAGQAVQRVASTVGGAAQEAGQQAAKFVGNLVPNQFGDPNLSTDEAYAACGPAAAIAFARANGRNPTLREAVDLARSVGWTTGGGMNGIANEKALLDKMGIASTLDPNPTWDKIAADASSGNPVAISTPRHYFVADGFDPQTGKYHVGASGTAFRAGAEWMTAEQISQIGGGVNGALFADHPSSPQPSVAVADQQAQKPVQNALSQLGAPTDQQAASVGQPQSIWERLGGGISDVFKNVFGGGSSSTPPPPPEGGGYGAVRPGGQNPLLDVFASIGQAAQTGQQKLAARGVQLDQPGSPTLPDTPILSQPRGLSAAGVQLDQPGSPTLPPTADVLLNQAASNVPEGVPVVAGALRGAAGMLNTPTPVEAAQTASAIEQKYGGGLQPKPGGGVAFRAPDYSNITPADREALSNATFAVGGVAAPIGPEGRLPGLGETRPIMPPEAAPPARSLSNEEAFTLHQDLGRQWQEIENQAAGLEAKSAEAFNPGLKARYANEAQRLRDQQDTLMQQADYLEQHGTLPPDTAPALPQETFSQPAPLPEPAATTAPLPTSPLGSTSILTSPLFQRLKTMRGTPEEQAALRPPDVGDAGNILLDKFPAEARPFLSDMADTFGQFAGQRRGVITDDQAMHNAAETALGTTIDQWIKTPAGKAFNQEQAIALGQTLAKVGREYEGLRTTVQAARQAGNVTPVMEAELADKALQLASLEGVRAGATAEAGRALRAFRQELQGAFGSAPGQRPDKAIQQAFKVLGGTEQFDQWVQEYAKIDPADTMARAKMLQTLTNPSAWDKLAAWRYASMLSSWQTHIQNAASNTGQALARPLRLGAAGYFKEASADLKGMLEAIPEAGAIFSQTLSSGISTGTLQKAETIRPRPFGEGPVGRAISLPTDLLAASDDFFRHINFQGAYRSAAYREAGGNMTKYEDLLANPRPDLVDEANQAAKIATFQEDPGTFVNNLLKLRQTPGFAGQAVSLLIPFIRTPANITRQGVSFGLKPITGTVGAVRAGLAGDVRTARLEAGQAALAGLFEAGLVVKALNGELSAEGPSDRATRDQLRSQGWQDHSIKLGDKWISYTQWGPASIPMATIAALTEAWQQGRPGQEIAPDVVAKTIRGFASATYLQSLGDVLKAISGDSEAITYLQNLGASTAGSLVPYGGALSAAARTFDPVEHAPTRDDPLLGTAQQLETRIPGLRQTVPVRQDILGQPLPTAASQTPLAGLTRVSQSRPQPALDILGTAGMHVSEPPDTVSLRPGISVDLTEDDKRRFQQFQGTLVEQIVGPLANDRAFQTAPQDIQRRILDQLLTKARQAAEKQTIGTLGGQDLDTRITKSLGLKQERVPALQRP